MAFISATIDSMTNNLLDEAFLKSDARPNVRLSKWGSKSNAGLLCIVFDTDNGEWCLKISSDGLTLVHWEKDKEKDMEPLNPSPRRVIHRLHKAGLETRMCYSKDRRHIFCFVALPYERMIQWADYRDFDQELDPTEAVKYGRSPAIDYPLAHHTLLEGEDDVFIRNFRSASGITTSTNNNDVEAVDSLRLNRLPLSLWKGVFVQYNAVVPQEIFSRYEDGSIFSVTNKLQMLDEIMKTDQDLDGAGLKIVEMANSSHPISAVFPVNDRQKLNNLIVAGTYWKFWGERWHEVSLSNIRSYYGEKVAFYFAFLQFYTASLSIAAFVGIGFFVAQILYHDKVACPGIILWVLFLIFWNLALCKNWERRQGYLRNKWGMVRYREKAIPRPQFHGAKGFCEISGLVQEFVPSKAKKVRKQCVSYSTVFFWTSLVCVVIFFMFHSKEKHKENEARVVLFGISNAVLIQMWNLFYIRVSDFLNNWENHRLESQFENNMIVKRIVFQCVNSFASLYYIGFIKPSFSRELYDTSDRSEINNEVLSKLQIQLSTLFLTLIVIQNTQEVVLGPIKQRIVSKYFTNHSSPYYTTTQSQPAIGEELNSFENTVLGEGFNPYNMEDLQEDAEIQIKLSVSANVMDNMSELIIEQGYATMFAIAFPLAPLLALCNNFVEFRVDSYNLRANRRPIPYGAYSVGLWGEVLWWFAGISVISNWALYIFRTNQVKHISGIDTTTTLQWVCFFIGIALIYSLLFIVNFVFLPTPDRLLKHQERTEEIEKFLIIKGLKKATKFQSDAAILERNYKPAAVSFKSDLPKGEKDQELTKSSAHLS